MKQFFLVFLFFIICALTSCLAQKQKLSIEGFEGVLVTGYVSQGAFVNFTGPSLSMKMKDTKFMVGMLPSFRLKKDSSSIKNSFITPTLGIGFTAVYKLLAFQLPIYYTPKTDFQPGRWSLGIGVGLNITKINQK